MNPLPTRRLAVANLVAGLTGALLLRPLSSQAADPEQRLSIDGEPGPYTVRRWKRDWPGSEFEDGVSEGRVSVTRLPLGNALRIQCAPGQIGPADGGAGWRWRFPAAQEASLSYALRFDPEFDFNKGGKLPGLSGGPETVTGGRPATGANGFSARLMWRRDGRGEAYVYHLRQPGKYGESFPFPDHIRFPRGAICHVRLTVAMNRPGERNGRLRVWIQFENDQELLVVDRSDMEWRSTEAFAIDSVQFEVFHGGGDNSWAPSRSCSVEIGHLALTAPPGA